MASDATARALFFSPHSSKILRYPHSGGAMKIPTPPREVAGCDEVRQVLGQRGRDLVFRAGATVVRRGNDVNGDLRG